VNDPFRYIYGVNGPGATPSDADMPGFAERCTSSGQLFVGGQGVTGLSQLKDGTLFVVGKFQRKLAGEVHCGIDVNVDHCDSLDPAHTDEAACVEADHQWIRVQPFCSDPTYTNPFDCNTNFAQWNPGMGFRHYDATGDACVAARPGFNRNFVDCRAPGGAAPAPGPNSFSEQVDGLAYLVPGIDGALGTLRLLSDPAETVERYWALEGSNGPELYYSVYANGQYNLRVATQGEDADGNPVVERRLLLTDYEVYNLERDPADRKRVMFDALQFSRNAYLFGSADMSLETSDAIEASVHAIAGVSGRVGTLIVLPNF